MESGVPVARAKGRIVFGEETAELHLHLRQLLAEHRKLVLNLREIRYIDSSGMGLLIGIYVSAARDGAQLKLVSVSVKVRRILSTAKLLELFELYEDEQMAVRACVEAPR